MVLGTSRKIAIFKVATLQRCGTFAILQCSFSGGSEQYESFGGVQGAIFKGQLCWVLTAVSRATPYTPPRRAHDIFAAELLKVS